MVVVVCHDRSLNITSVMAMRMRNEIMQQQ
jgi:hypothetical protein